MLATGIASPSAFRVPLYIIEAINTDIKSECNLWQLYRFGCLRFQQSSLAPRLRISAGRFPYRPVTVPWRPVKTARFSALFLSAQPGTAIADISGAEMHNCFCNKNIPYFLCKVNALYRSLIIFGRVVYFQHCFFGNNNTNQLDKIKKLQIGKRVFNAYFTKQTCFFYAYCPKITISGISAASI